MSNDMYINKKLFQPSIWDNFPMKRDNKYTDQIIQSDFKMDITESIKLPNGFCFVELDVSRDAARISDFLNNHYTNTVDVDVDGEGSKYTNKIIYSPEYIRYIYQTPRRHFKKLHHLSPAYWVFGVEGIVSGELYGFISAKPMTYTIDTRLVNGMLIDKLCTHKDARRKRMSIILLKEMYRKLGVIENECVAIFNTFYDVPFRAITEKSTLLQLTFASDTQSPSDLQKMEKRRHATTDPKKIKKIEKKIMAMKTDNIWFTKDIHNIRLANNRDVDKLMEIYDKYNHNYRFYRSYNKKEFEHDFLPRRDLVYTYVLTNSQGEVKDFISLLVFNNNEHEKIGYIFYISFLNDELLKIFAKNVFYILKKSNFDKIVCNEWFGVSNVFKKTFNFKPINCGNISSWYSFNYNTKTIPQHECGMIMML